MRRAILICLFLAVAGLVTGATVQRIPHPIVSSSARVNYWGTGAEGDVTISTNTNLTSTEDGDIVVKHYRNLTINSSRTLTVSSRCRGLVLFVDGNLTVNGTITMQQRGGKCNPADATTSTDTPVAPGDGHGVGTNGIRFPFRTAAGSDTLAQAEFEGCGTALYDLRTSFPALSSNGTILAIARTGAAGGTSPGSNGNGTDGTDGSTNQSGGGGSGARYSTAAGAGGAGTCFSGGAGGGGSNTGTPTAGSSYGGAGGNGSGVSGGGSGNPGGNGYDASYNGQSGSGGLLVIICSGNINVESGGYILSRGSAGGGVAGSGSGGGGSAGGNIVLIYTGTYTNNGIVSVTGGAGGAGNSRTGGAGGDGCIQTLKVLP